MANIRWTGALLGLGMALAIAGQGWAQPGAAAGPAPAPAVSEPPPADYSDKANWLCWPGRAGDACDVDLSTTVVAADGSTRIEPFTADPKAPIDCFYVYPTVSTDPGLLATLAVEPAEQRVIEQQFARFRSKCRAFAPVYRQVTLTALFGAMTGHPLPGSAPPGPKTPYADVLAAWQYYLAHENNGRGVVLIGHSQGSGVLERLIANEIDGKPDQAKLVSAVLAGTVLTVPKGADVGGDFKTIPLCHSPTQLGCAIAFASFRDTIPPPDNSRFGRPRIPSDTLVAACVNPANLGGGSGDLESYLSAGGNAITPGAAPAPVWEAGKTIATPFVALPGMLSAQCVSTPQFNYLAIHVNADPAGPRAKDINGDVVLGGVVQKNWGLHLIDMNLTMGNLLDIVGQESAAWTARGR
jgi:hypothetical protein